MRASDHAAVNLSIVIPCFNEELVLPQTAERIAGVLEDLCLRGRIRRSSRIFLVDDGSRDSTWRIIEQLTDDGWPIVGIKLSRNRGHQHALLAGLHQADGDAVISMDADLQHDPAAIEPMLDEYLNGHDVVLGIRQSRTAESWFKRTSGALYYRMLKGMGVDIVPEHADYRLLSRRAIAALRQFGETELFLRGIIPQLGFPTAKIHYQQAERAAGESKYSLAKMLGLAIQGVTSFSAAPLRFITLLGVLVSIASLGFSAYALWIRLLTDTALPGWASTVVPMYFLGGIQLLCLGIIGEYLSKIYIETKRRPVYIIEKVHAGEPRPSRSPSRRHRAAREAVAG